MNAFVLWSLLPGVFGFLLYMLRRWERAVRLSGVALAMLLAWMAWQLPIGQAIPLRLWSGLPALLIQPEATFFSSQFLLSNSVRPALVLLYGSAAFWFGGSSAARTHRLFTPLGLAIAALVTAALAVQSIPAAALFITLAGIMSIPVLSPPGEPARSGALRFLVYITGGACLVLFADAYLSAALVNPAGIQPGALTPILLMLALGFAMILAVTPFHTWMPMLAEEAHSYSSAFAFYMLPMAVAFLALEVLGRYSVSGLVPGIYAILKVAGALMVVTGGGAAVLDRHLGRILGFASVALMGMTLLAVSLNDQLGRPTPLIGIFFAQLTLQGLGLAVWGLALSILRSYHADLDFAGLRGIARSFPFAAGTVVLANLAIAGQPLLSSFPIYLALWTALARDTPAIALISILGMSALAAAALRSLAVMLIAPETQSWKASEGRGQIALLAIGCLALLLAGCFPQVYLPVLTNLALVFAGGGP